MLGNRYIAKIKDDEAGSTLGEINQKLHPQLMMQQFLESYQESVENENLKQSDMPEMPRRVSQIN